MPLVRETGLEPVRDYHTPLKRARLPIPPLSRFSLRTEQSIAQDLLFVKRIFTLFLWISSENGNAGEDP